MRFETLLSAILLSRADLGDAVRVLAGTAVPSGPERCVARVRRTAGDSRPYQRSRLQSATQFRNAQ